MISIRNIKLSPGYTDKDVTNAIKRELRLDKGRMKHIDILRYEILKESLDSRNHDRIFYLLNVGVELTGDNKNPLNRNEENKIISLVNNKDIMLTKPFKYNFPHILNMEIRAFLEDAPEYRPIIVGSGPAGYFAGVKLAEAGFSPIILERGKAVEERKADIEKFWEEGVLDSESNVCFGEGGAGTFSDGKLNTGNKDKEGYFQEVLRTFVRYGAPAEVLYKAKPHIGTDVLMNILRNMRKDIEKYGGEVRFQNTLIDIDYEADQIDHINTFGYESELPLYEISVRKADGNIYKLKTHTVILAIGHSARDTYRMLLDRDYAMSPKAFAMGVRVEHLQETINEAMYGRGYRDKYKQLPAADYKLVYHTGDDRSVFSFCMCPGGYVVNSSTEEGATVINGMSYSGRNGKNANSAIVVGVNPSDWAQSCNNSGADNNKEAVIAGLDYQLNLEKKAYVEGKGGIPLQLLGDLTEGRVSTETGSITPEIKGIWHFGNMANIFPDYILKSILEAFSYFGKRLAGYDAPDTVITAVESRTSSPVRIERNKDMSAVNHPGIYPIGEGAGFAGGITSAAADGIKCAERLSEYLIDDMVESYKAFETAKYL